MSSPTDLKGLSVVQPAAQIMVWMGGSALIIMALIITISALGRKFFNVFLPGVDEISTYVFAVSTTGAFAYAVFARVNIRIDIVRERFGTKGKLVLDLFAWACFTIVFAINAFGNVTEDLDAMHMDPEWSKQHNPFGSTIAYGFQTLSMLTAMINDILPRGSQEAYKLNYGFDRVRLMSPVKVGARIRGRARLKDLRTRKDGSTIVSIDVEVEIQGEEKPALVATWLFLIANDIAGRRRPVMKEELH